MINTARLLGEIRANGKTQSDVAKHLEMDATTFYRKLKRGVFDSDEIEKMIRLLDIKNPIDIFFTSVDT